MGADDDPLGLRTAADPTDIAENLISHCRRRLRITPSFAIVTGLGEGTQEVLPHPFTRNLNQPKVGDSGHSGAGLVSGHRFEQRVIHLVAILLTLHIDEIDDDDTTDPT